MGVPIGAARNEKSGGPMGVARGPAPPVEMLPMIKLSLKRLLFLLFQFLSATLHTTVHAYTTVINNNIDPQQY